MGKKIEKIALPLADGEIIELNPVQAKALLGALASYVKGVDADWSTPDPTILNAVLVRMRQGESLSDICTHPFPPPDVIVGWCKADPQWKTAFNEAVLHQAEAAFNKVNSLLNNLRTRMEQGDVPSQNEISSYRLQLETLRWLCAKLNPAKYSDYSRLGVDQNTAWRIVYQAVCPICGKTAIEGPGPNKPGLVNNPKAAKLLSPAATIKKEWWGKNTTHPGSKERILRIGGKKKHGEGDNEKGEDST